MNTMNYTQFRANLATALDDVNENYKPIIITRRKGKPAVIISLDDFNSYSTPHCTDSKKIDLIIFTDSYLEENTPVLIKIDDEPLSKLEGMSLRGYKHVIVSSETEELLNNMSSGKHIKIRINGSRGQINSSLSLKKFKKDFVKLKSFCSKFE